MSTRTGPFADPKIRAEWQHTPSRTFQVELVWNREFDWCRHGDPRATLDEAIGYARAVENMGDGAAVKKTRVVDADGNVLWAYGKKVTK